MKLRTILCIGAAMLAAALATPTTVTAGPRVMYDYSDEDFPNPERGMFKHIDLTASQGNSLALSALKRYRQEGYSLVYTGYIMDSYRDGADIPEIFFRRMRNNMDRLRQAGLKAVVRFYYSADGNSKPWDMPLDVTLRHIEQIKPVLQENSDVIALVEAGFVGVWGEWYQTENHKFNPQTQSDYENRRKIVEALADAVPKDRMIALRTPMYKMGILNITATDTLRASTAHDPESLQARLGFHNDCFLANADDAGTYGGVQANRKFTRYDSRYTVMGGETCSEANSFTELVNAKMAFSDYHWTYLNSDYHPGALGEWAENGFLDEIRRRLGYRLTLLEGEYPQSIEAGTPFEGHIWIENVGWAAPINPRLVEIVLIDGEGAKHPFRLDIDPRTWQPYYVHQLDFTFDLPVDLPAGDYEMYLNLPAPEEKIYDRPEYAIRTANKDCWDETLGMNHLATVSITPNTGITAATAEPADDLAPVYDMMGRCVGRVGTSATLSPGIYIINGKKYRMR